MPKGISTISKAGVFLSSIVAAVASDQMSHVVEASHPMAGPVLLVLSHIMSDIGSEFIAPIGEEISSHIFNTPPNQLNHDIQIALIDSISKALDNIEYLYKHEYPGEKLNNSTRQFLRNLKKDITGHLHPHTGVALEENELRQVIFSSDSKPDYNYLFDSSADNKILNKMTETLAAELKDENIDEKFAAFFIKNFIPTIQAYFGKALKETKYTPARVAFERMLSEETLIGIKKLIELQQKSENDIQALKSQNALAAIGKLSDPKLKKLKELLDDINQPAKLQIEYSKALDSRLNDLYEQYRSVQYKLDTIGANVEQIKGDLLRRLKVTSLLLTLSAVVCGIAFSYWYWQPYNTRLMIRDQAGAIPFTDLNEIVLHLNTTPDNYKLDKNASTDIIPVPGKYKHTSVSIELPDDKWVFENNTHQMMLDLHEGTQTLIVKPDSSSMCCIAGYVMDNAGAVLADVHMMAENVKYTTDTNGFFQLIMPRSKWGKEVTVYFYKAGYDTANYGVLPGRKSMELKLDKK